MTPYFVLTYEYNAARLNSMYKVNIFGFTLARSCAEYEFGEKSFILVLTPLLLCSAAQLKEDSSYQCNTQGHINAKGYLELGINTSFLPSVRKCTCAEKNQEMVQDSAAVVGYSGFPKEQDSVGMCIGTACCVHNRVEIAHCFYGRYRLNGQDYRKNLNFNSHFVPISPR